MKLGHITTFLSALVLFGCGGLEEPAEETSERTYRHSVVSAAEIRFQPAAVSQVMRVGDVIRRLDDTHPTEPSPRLDLEQYKLSDDEYCGDVKCPAVPDLPCEAYAAGVQVICACEHRDYLFICR